jgi:hypothetical protein
MASSEHSRDEQHGDFDRIKDDLKGDLARAVTSLGGYVAAREDQITELIERTAGKVDDRTEHRYTGTIDKVRAGLRLGVARLADRAQEGPDGPGGPEQPR